MSKPTPGPINLIHPAMGHDNTTPATEQKPQTTNEENEVEIQDSVSG